MRLGEIKQKLNLVVDDNKHILLDHEALYNNEIYKLKNYQLVIEALKSIKDFDWVEQEFLSVQEVINAKSEINQSEDLTQAEFTKINSYVSVLNQKLPIFYSMLASVVQDQDEKVINIKLPANIKEFKELDALNKRLYDTLKLYNIDGQFDFVEFDKGTDWYVVYATGHFSYLALIGGLNIANKYFEAKKIYHESEEAKYQSKKAKLDYMAATKELKEPSEKELQDFIDRRLQLEVNEEIDNFIKNTRFTTGNENENKTKILKATHKLIKELEKEDFEFHLSLNPPKYASEENGNLVIKYDSLPVIDKKKEIAKIEANKEDVLKK